MRSNIPLTRDTGSTDPDARYKNEQKWHGWPGWLKEAAIAHKASIGQTGAYPEDPFVDSLYHDLFRGLFDHEISFKVGEVEHWATMPYHDIYPVALSFAENLGIELVSFPGERWSNFYVYEFRPLTKKNK